MAIDTALLDRARRGGAPVLRLYRWQPHCLSLGRHEPALRRYDPARIEALGLDVVRRPTGGRAVWHANELTYSVSGPVALLGSLREAYTTIHEFLAVALQRLGVPATLAPRPFVSATLDRGACFSTPAGGEIVVRGSKLVGSAQVRRDAGLLQHGSILLDGRQDVVAAVTRGTPPHSGETSVSELLQRPVSFDEMARAIVAALAATHANTPSGQFTDREAVIAEAKFHETQYRDSGWTWSR